MNRRRFGRWLGMGLLMLALLGLLAPVSAAKQGPIPPSGVPDEPALCRVSSPNGGEVSVLNAITSIPASSVSVRPGMWAVGYTASQAMNRPALATLTMYYSGRNWKIVPSPNVADENVLTAVAANATDDVWAVGYAGTGVKQTLLALHYNGVEWAPVALPSVPIASSMRLTDVTFLNGASKPYAVAVGYADTPYGPQALAFYYDGLIWQPLGLSATTPPSRLFAIVGTSLKDLWAVGTMDTAKSSDAYLFHYNAAGWQPIRKGIGLLTDLAIAGNRIFTVGRLTTDKGMETLVMAYTPASGDWSQIKSFNKDGATSILTGLAISGEKVYAVGYTSSPTSNRELTTLVLSYDGVSFAPVVAPSPNMVSELHGAVVNEGILWTVGATGQGLQRSTLVLTNSCPVNQ